MAELDSNLENLRKKISMSRDSEFNVITHFNPYRINMEYNDVYIKGIPYIFMTRPVLNLSDDNIKTSDFLTLLLRTPEDRKILRNLTHDSYIDTSKATLIGSRALGESNFVPLITNLAMSIDLKDTAARTKEVGETLYGYKQVYPGSTIDSIVGDEISIKYIEMSNIPIIKFHKAWLEYIEGVRRGKFLASEKSIEGGFIDFLVSIYYILCDFDAETIIYWAKYTGCAPLIVPYSSFGGEFNSHTIPDFTINYSYCHKADMDYSILRDFNRVSWPGVKGKESLSNLDYSINNASGDDIISNGSQIKNADNKDKYSYSLSNRTKIFRPVVSNINGVLKLEFLNY